MGPLLEHLRTNIYILHKYYFALRTFFCTESWFWISCPIVSCFNCMLDVAGSQNRFKLSWLPLTPRLFILSSCHPALNFETSKFFLVFLSLTIVPLVDGQSRSKFRNFKYSSFFRLLPRAKHFVWFLCLLSCNNAI